MEGVDTMGFDLDLDDPEDATLVLAAIDDDDRGDGRTGIQRAAGRAAVHRAGCGCVGCLMPILAIAAATAAGLGALPLAAVLVSLRLALALMDRTPPSG
jgi:hypothetical protein